MRDSQSSSLDSLKWKSWNLYFVNISEYWKTLFKWTVFLNWEREGWVLSGFL